MIAAILYTRINHAIVEKLSKISNVENHKFVSKNVRRFWNARIIIVISSAMKDSVSHVHIRLWIMKGVYVKRKLYLIS